MLDFIELLREKPLVGFLIGLVVFVILFSAKNIVVYLYSRHVEKEKRRRAEESQARTDADTQR